METDWMGYGREWVCAAAGPFTGAILGACLLRRFPDAALISLELSAVNLLPLYPLDGGRMLCSFAYSVFREETAGRVVRVIVVGTCAALMVGICWITIVLRAGVWPMFAVLLMLCRAGDSEKQLLFFGAKDKMNRQVK